MYMINEYTDEIITILKDIPGQRTGVLTGFL